MSPSSALPTPMNCQYDADGRLIALSVAGGPLPAGVNAWLVAIDGSTDSQQAVSEAIRLSLQMRCPLIQLAHIQSWMSREAADSELLRRAWATSETARLAIEAAGLTWQLNAALGDCAEGIVHTAREQACQGIVIGSRGLGAAANLLLGSTAYKVIHLSPIPVLVAKAIQHTN